MRKKGVDSFISGDAFNQVVEFYKTSRKFYKYRAYSQASIESFLDYYGNTTGVFNSLVHGGRTNNERYWETSRDYCADIDLSSCYGSALTDFVYPVGLPVVYATGPNQRKMTLGTFLKKYEHRLVPNLYKIVVSTKEKLPFQQDLI